LEEKKTCQWIRSVENRRVKLCKKAHVQDACPQTCGLCCQDDDEYTFINNFDAIVDCEYVAKKPVRQETWCDEYKNGTTVKNACPVACGICQTYVTVSPSVSP